jgi:hypothetical protein
MGVLVGGSIQVIGVPPRAVLEQSKRRKLFFDAANVPRIVPNSRGKKRIPGAKDIVSMVRLLSSF